MLWIIDNSCFDFQHQSNILTMTNDKRGCTPLVSTSGSCYSVTVDSFPLHAFDHTVIKVIDSAYNYPEEFFYSCCTFVKKYNIISEGLVLQGRYGVSKYCHSVK